MKFKAFPDAIKMLTDFSISQIRVSSHNRRFKHSTRLNILKIWLLLPILLIILSLIAREITSNRSHTFAVNNPLKSMMKTQERQ